MWLVGHRPAGVYDDGPSQIRQGWIVISTNDLAGLTVLEIRVGTDLDPLIHCKSAGRKFVGGRRTTTCADLRKKVRFPRLVQCQNKSEVGIKLMLLLGRSCSPNPHHRYSNDGFEIVVEGFLIRPTVLLFYGKQFLGSIDTRFWCFRRECGSEFGGGQVEGEAVNCILNVSLRLQVALRFSVQTLKIC